MSGLIKRAIMLDYLLSVESEMVWRVTINVPALNIRGYNRISSLVATDARHFYVSTELCTDFHSNH